MESNVPYQQKYMDDLREYIIDKGCNGIDVSMLDIRPALIEMVTDWELVSRPTRLVPVA